MRFWSRIHVIQQKFQQNPMAFPVKDGSPMVPQEKTTRILWATDFLSRASAAFAETPAVSSELWEKHQAAFLDKDLSMKQINDVSFKHSSYIITVHMYILYNYIYIYVSLIFSIQKTIYRLWHSPGPRNMSSRHFSTSPSSEQLTRSGLETGQRVGSPWRYPKRGSGLNGPG